MQQNVLECNKHSGFVRSELDSLQLRTESEGVLFLSGDSESLGDVLRGDAAQTHTCTDLTAARRTSQAVLILILIV